MKLSSIILISLFSLTGFSASNSVDEFFKKTYGMELCESVRSCQDWVNQYYSSPKYNVYSIAIHACNRVSERNHLNSECLVKAARLLKEADIDREIFGDVRGCQFDNPSNFIPQNMCIKSYFRKKS